MSDLILGAELLVFKGATSLLARQAIDVIYTEFFIIPHIRARPFYMISGVFWRSLIIPFTIYSKARMAETANCALATRFS